MTDKVTFRLVTYCSLQFSKCLRNLQELFWHDLFHYLSRLQFWEIWDFLDSYIKEVDPIIQNPLDNLGTRTSFQNYLKFDYFLSNKNTLSYIKTVWTTVLVEKMMTMMKIMMIIFDNNECDNDNGDYGMLGLLLLLMMMMIWTNHSK